MTAGTARIRWHAEPEASIVAFTGRVGTVDPVLFKIFQPERGEQESVLTCPA